MFDLGFSQVKLRNYLYFYADLAKLATILLSTFTEKLTIRCKGNAWNNNRITHCVSSSLGIWASISIRKSYWKSIICSRLICLPYSCTSNCTFLIACYQKIISSIGKGVNLDKFVLPLIQQPFPLQLKFVLQGWLSNILSVAFNQRQIVQSLV